MFVHDSLTSTFNLFSFSVLAAAGHTRIASLDEDSFHPELALEGIGEDVGMFVVLYYVLLLTAGAASEGLSMLDLDYGLL